MAEDFLIDGKTLKQICEEKWLTVPEDVQQKAVAILKATFSPELKEEIRARIAAKPDNWIGVRHHGWGTSVRNTLRTQGLMDDVLPEKNWDDYYVKAIELAV